MLLYHGSDQIVTQPEIRVHKYYKDFGWGLQSSAA